MVKSVRPVVEIGLVHRAIRCCSVAGLNFSMPCFGISFSELHRVPRGGPLWNMADEEGQHAMESYIQND